MTATTTERKRYTSKTASEISDKDTIINVTLSWPLRLIEKIDRLTAKEIPYTSRNKRIMKFVEESLELTRGREGSYDGENVGAKGATAANQGRPSENIGIAQ